MVRRKIPQLGWLGILAAVRVDVQRCQKRSSALYPHADIQRTALCPVFQPGQVFRIADPLPSFGNGPAAYPGQDQFMPNLFFSGQLFVFFPPKVTSLMAIISALDRESPSGPRSGSASPVMSSTVKTAEPSSLRM